MKPNLTILIRSMLLALLTWLVTFAAYAASASLPSHFYGNRFRYLLFDLWRQSVELDEELITLSGMIVWSLFFGVALAAKCARLPALRFAVFAVLVIPVSLLGVGVLRHGFHGIGAKAFHSIYSLAMIASAVLVLMHWWREYVRKCEQNNAGSA